MNQFEQKIIKQYGEDAYDLSKTRYTGQKIPVTVICPDHGEFEISPNNLIYCAGCPQCRNVHPRGYPKGIKRGKNRGRVPQPFTVYLECADGKKMAVNTVIGRSDRKSYLYRRVFHSYRVAHMVIRVVETYFKNTLNVDNLCEVSALIESLPTKRFE